MAAASSTARSPSPSSVRPHAHKSGLRPSDVGAARTLAEFAPPVLGNRTKSFDDVAGERFVDEGVTRHPDRIAVGWEAHERLGCKHPPTLGRTLSAKIADPVDANAMVVEKISRDDSHGVPLNGVHRRHLEGEAGRAGIGGILAQDILRKRPGSSEIPSDRERQDPVRLRFRISRVERVRLVEQRRCARFLPELHSRNRDVDLDPRPDRDRALLVKRFVERLEQFQRGARLTGVQHVPIGIDLRVEMLIEGASRRVDRAGRDRRADHLQMLKCLLVLGSDLGLSGKRLVAEFEQAVGRRAIVGVEGGQRLRVAADLLLKGVPAPDLDVDRPPELRLILRQMPAGQGSYDDRRVYRLQLDDRDPAECRRILTRYLARDRVRDGSAFEDAQADYRDAAGKREAMAALPRAWAALVTTPEELLVDLLSEQVATMCGYRPAASDAATFLQRLKAGGLPVPAPTAKPVAPVMMAAPVLPGARPVEPPPPAISDDRSIRYTLLNRPKTAANASAALIDILRTLAARDPTKIETLADAVRGRSRSLIARSVGVINPKRPDLARAVEFTPGWLVGLNTANREKMAMIRAAVDIFGLAIPDDLDIALPNA